ncbi:MAG: GNAT family N-acetyltransferase [Aeromicrobium sp.]|nr:MAG: GNAT family N-acetyltransferase [Aeromicrobium sp.]
MSADVSARLAWPEDASAIARIQWAHWHSAFSDVLGQNELAEAKEADMATRWSQIISTPPDARVRTLVALTRSTVHGFALVHPCHDPDGDEVSDGEIGEFIIDSANFGEGHGSRLLQACVDTLRADGFTRAVWWLASTDDATRSFAESAGWAPDGAHRELANEADQTKRLKQIRLHTALA